MDGAAVRELQMLAREVHLGDDLLRWITRLVRASRPQADCPEPVRQCG